LPCNLSQIIINIYYILPAQQASALRARKEL